MATDRVTTYSRIEGKIVRETAAAVLLKVYPSGDSHWFPLSQVQALHRNCNEDGGRQDAMDIADWILAKKGIEL